MSTEGLISARTLWEGVKELEGRHKAEAKYNPEFVTHREERLILEFKRLLREAEAEYVSIPHAARLTGWGAATLRQYAAQSLEGARLPTEWGLLTARRSGKEYAVVLATVPAKPKRAESAA